MFDKIIKTQSSCILLGILILLLGCLPGYSQDCNDTVKEGDGTFYEGVAGGSEGNCSLPVAADDFYHVGLSTIDYDGSKACGSCILVEGPKGKVKLKVVDRCPECKEGDLDIARGAFSEIADTIDGRVPVRWKFVPCFDNSSSPKISVNFKEGSSPFWTAIQLRDHNHAIGSLAYRNQNNEWVNIERKNYNFFVAPNGIASPMSLRAVSVLGESLEFNGIVLDLETDLVTDFQFSTPVECQNILSIFNNEDDFTSVRLFPNPTSSFIKIRGVENPIWSLMSLNGSILSEGQTSKIDLALLPDGLYIVKIDKNQFYKILKNSKKP